MALIITDNFNRANSTTVGNNWIDWTGANGGSNSYQILSDSLQAQSTIANISSTTLSAAATAGTNTVTLTSVTSLAVNNILLISTGTANFEAGVITGIVGSVVTLANNLVNNHSNGDTVKRQQFRPLLRQASENVLSNQIQIITGAMSSSASHFSIYARWQNPGNYIRFDFNWVSNTELTTTLYYAVNGVETSVNQVNFAAINGEYLKIIATFQNTNPTVVINSMSVGTSPTGPWTPTLYPTNQFQETANITTSNASAVQSTGYQGVSLENTGANCSLTSFSTYNTVAASVAYNATNAKAAYSPFNWYDSGTYLQSGSVGAYAKFSFTGTQISISQIISQWQSGATPAYWKYSVDGGPAVVVFPNSTTIFSVLGLPYGTHTLQLFYLQFPTNGTIDVWTVPASCVQISGYTLDTSEGFVAPTLNTKTAIFFTDSLGLKPTAPSGSYSDPTYGFMAEMCRALDLEYGIVPYGSQGYAHAGQYNAPQLIDPSSDADTSWNKFFAGTSRLTSGAFTPAPNYIFCEEMVNDSIYASSPTTFKANVVAALTAWRAAAPNATIVIFSDVQVFNGTTYQTYMQTAYNTYIAASGDQNCFFFVPDPALAAIFQATGVAGTAQGTLGSDDGIHPNLYGMAQVTGSIVKSLIQTLSPSRGSTGLINILGTNKSVLLIGKNGILI